MEPLIQVKHLSKAFGANVVLKDINYTKVMLFLLLELLVVANQPCLDALIF